MPKVAAFVDGENLVQRFQAMVKDGSSPWDKVVHEPDCFAWSPHITLWRDMDVVRVAYYTSVVGDDDRVRAIETKIASTTFKSLDGGHHSHPAQLIPRVHKKPKRSQKLKVIDVSITMDVMRAATTMPIDAIFLLSGDGDYVPLIREITRTTSKQVYIGAFSSGLAEEMRTSAEAFVDLDGLFFLDPVTGKYRG